jgi:predicted metal-dependent phosphoesterase TrpH
MKKSKNIERYDLHMHTKYSSCAVIQPRTILKTAMKKGLSGFAVTDHNEIKGAFDVKRLAKKYPDFEVVVGEEIMTDVGEVLGYFLDTHIKPGRFMDVIDKIRSQDGIISVSHPFSDGIIRRSILKDADQKTVRDLTSSVDAIETFNARTTTKENMLADKFAQKHCLARTAGSDAHFPYEIGRGYVEFKGDLRDAILKKRTRPGGDNSLMWFGRVGSLLPKTLNTARGKLRRIH